MNILVVNLTRFGDLLQSASALSALARGTDTPNRLALVCLDNFTATTAFLPHVEQVFPLPGGKLLAGLQAEHDGKTWRRAVADMTAWADEIHEAFAPDRVCNITPTLSARLLSRYLANDGPVDGFGLDPMGFGANASPWAAFMQGAAKSRGISPFNVVDLFRKVALGPADAPYTAKGPADAPYGAKGAADASLLPPVADIIESMRAELAALAPQGCKGFVALQMGASEDRRRWPEASFAAVGDALWREEGFCPLLLGSEDERPLAERYAVLSRSPFINLVGRTKLPQLAAALQNSALLVSNDTGTLHLASGLGTPVLGIFLATAQPWDTGPYRAGNCSLEPDLDCHPCAFGSACPRNLACHAAVRPETVAALARCYLARNAWAHPDCGSGAAADIAPPPHYAGSRVWQSAIDAWGFADLISLSGHEKETRTVWLRGQRHFYRQFLDRDTNRPFSPQPLPAPLALAPDAAQTLADECQSALTMLDALLQQGELLLARPLPQIRERFLATWLRLAAFLRESPHLAALALLWQEETQNSDDVPTALALTAQYRELLAALLGASSL